MHSYRNTIRLFLLSAVLILALWIGSDSAYASSAYVGAGSHTHPSKFSDCLVIDGVDVSYFQYDVDWERVKRQGIDYALIRIGYTGLDSPFGCHKDSYFESNYANARAAGLMVGVYYYSCATTAKEAQQEAAFVLNTLNGRALDLPVVYDCEYAGRLATAYQKWPSGKKRSTLTTNSLAFLNAISAGGYEPMFYSYRNMMCSVFNPSGYKLNMNLIDSKYKVWLAQYSTDNSYARPYEFWQYTSSGSVTGISGNVDCDFWYYDNSAEKTKSGTTSIKKATVTLGQKSYAYTKFKKTPAVTVTLNGTKLTKGKDYQVYYLKNVLAGTAYALVRGTGSYSNAQLVPFTITTTDIAKGGTAADISAYTYNGSARKPTPKVMYKNTTLKKGVDYTLSYSNNVKVGTATVTIKGRRNYYGSFTKTFRINKALPTFSGYASYSREVGSVPWTLNTKCSSGGKLTYTSNNPDIATVDAAGKVTLTGKTGTANITVQAAATANYKAASTQVKISVKVPGASNAGIIKGVQNTTLKASSSLGAGYIKVQWTKSSNYKMDYYQVFRSTSKTFGSKPFYTTKTNGTTYKNTYNLKAGTRYYYKVRGVRVINGKKYYTKWSTLAYRVYKKPTSNAGIIKGVQNTTLKASSSLGSGCIKVQWTKSPGYKVDYYQVFRSTSKTFGSKPFYTTKTNGLTYKNTYNLKAGTCYYYKVRGVRVINGKKYYTKWSTLAYRVYR